MSKPKKSPRKHRRIVLKFGSAILTTNSRGLDLKQFARISAEVAALIRQGYQCVAVTSGAVAAGTSVLALRERREAVAARGGLASNPISLRSAPGALVRA